MNIFATSKDPILSAICLDDKRLVKMCLETAQIVSTSLHLTGRGADRLYRPTHIRHPCVIWAIQDAHLNWLMQHFYGLLLEYTFRYHKVHASKFIFDVVCELPLKLETCEIDFVNCARNSAHNLDFTHLPVHVAYRHYLQARWATDKRLPTWTYRNKPNW